MFSCPGDPGTNLLKRLFTSESYADENIVAQYKKRIRATTRLDELILLMNDVAANAILLDPSALNCLIKKFGSFKQLALARQLYLLAVKIQWTDHIINNSMISVAGENNDLGCAKEVYAHALEREYYDKMTFSTMINVASLNGEYVTAKQVYHHALEVDLADTHTYTHIIKAAGNYHDIETAVAAYRRASKTGYIDIHVHNAMMQAYIANTNLDAAISIYNKILHCKITNVESHLIILTAAQQATCPELIRDAYQNAVALHQLNTKTVLILAPNLRLMPPPAASLLNPNAAAFRPLNAESQPFAPKY